VHEPSRRLLNPSRTSVSTDTLRRSDAAKDRPELAGEFLLVSSFTCCQSPSERSSINGTFMAGLCLRQAATSGLTESNYRIAIKDLLMACQNSDDTFGKYSILKHEC